MQIVDVHCAKVKMHEGQFVIQVAIPEEVKEVLVFHRANVVETVSMIGRDNCSIFVNVYDFPAGMCGYIDEVFRYCDGETMIYRVMDDAGDCTKMCGIILMRTERVNHARINEKD